MKQGPVAEHIQNACGRINYTSRLDLDDPWKMLAFAVLLQGALDFINWNLTIGRELDGLKPGVAYLSTYQFYADMIGLDIPADEFLGLVFENQQKIYSAKKQRHATAWLDRYLKGGTDDGPAGQTEE